MKNRNKILGYFIKVTESCLNGRKTNAIKSIYFKTKPEDEIKCDCAMFFGDTPVDKDNQNGGRVDILLIFIVVLKLTTHLFRTLWVVRFK